MDTHTGWKSPATERTAVTIVIAAFNYAQDNHDAPNPLKGLKKLSSRLRLHSLTDDDLATLLRAADTPFRDFLFAAVERS